MLRLNFEILPFWKPPAFDSYWTRFRKLTKNKGIEAQLMRSEALFGLDLNLCPWGRHHAGLEFELTVLHLCFNVKLYDFRHWNYEENRWATPEEEAEDAREEAGEANRDGA